jgi:hypothetical protein
MPPPTVSRFIIAMYTGLQVNSLSNFMDKMNQQIKLFRVALNRRYFILLSFYPLFLVVELFIILLCHSITVKLRNNIFHGVFHYLHPSERIIIEHRQHFILE